MHISLNASDFFHWRFYFIPIGIGFSGKSGGDKMVEDFLSNFSSTQVDELERSL